MAGKATVENRILVDGNEAGKSLKDLKEEIRQTSKELDKLPRGTQQFNDKMQQLSSKKAVWSNHRKELKNMEVAQNASNDGLLKYVGNMRVAGLSLNGLQGGIKGSIAQLKMFKISLMSTGIGAIVILLGSLVAWLMKTQQGMELIRKATDAASAAIDVITDRIIQVGEGLALIIQGKFDEGLTKITTAADGLGDELEREVQLAWDLADAMIQLEKAETDLTLTKAQRRSEIYKLILASKDQTNSVQERIDALQKANDLEQAIMDESLALQEERLRLAQLEYDRATSTEEDRKKLVAEQVKLEEMKTESLKLQTTLTSQLGGLQKKLAAEETKRAAEVQKLADAKAKALEKEQAELEKIQEFLDKQLADMEAKKLTAQERELLKIDEHYAAQIEKAQGHDQLVAELEAARDMEKEILLEEQRQLQIQAEAEFLDEINMLQGTAQDRELLASQKKYDALIKQAKQFNLDTAGLERMRQKEINGINQKYGDQYLQDKNAIHLADLEATRSVTGSLMQINMAMNGERGKSNAFAKLSAAFQIGVSSAEAIAKATAASQNVPFPGNIAATLSSIAVVASNIAQARQLIGGSSAPRYASGFAGIPGGALHASGGIQMIDSMTGHMVGEMERNEPYMILSRNTYANNRDTVDALIDSTLHRGGAPIYATGGVMGNPNAGAVPSSASVAASAGSGGNQELINEMKDLNASVKNLQFIRAILSSDATENELDEREKIRAESQI